MTIGLEVLLLAQNLMMMLKKIKIAESFIKYLLYLCPGHCVWRDKLNI